MPSRLALILGLALAATPQPLASSIVPTRFAVIINDRGGIIDDYVARYSKWAAEGRTIIVAGPCASACTLALDRRLKLDVCGTRHANFLFHKPYVLQKDGDRLYVKGGRAEVAAANHDWRRQFLMGFSQPLRDFLSNHRIPSPAAGDAINHMVGTGSKTPLFVKSCGPLTQMLTRSHDVVTVIHD